MQCFSCKNKGSKERCAAACIQGHMLCGRHLHMKQPKYWIDANPHIEKAIIKVQALWRTYDARRRIRLAGPGVFRRSMCHNEDDMVTAEEKTKVSPLEYFAIEEAGKVWWFEQKTILQWAHQNESITNPFTRTPFSQSDMRRIRQLYTYRLRRKEQIWHTPITAVSSLERQELRWRRVSQFMSECGYGDEVSVNHWLTLSFPQLILFANILAEDIRWWVHQTSVPSKLAWHSRRHRVLTWIQHYCKHVAQYQSIVRASSDLAGLLNSIAAEFKDPSELAFFYLSAHFKTLMVL